MLRLAEARWKCKGKTNGARRGKGGRKGKKNGARRGKGGRKGKKNGARRGKGGRKGKKNGGKVKSNAGGLGDQLYNQLWCVDLAIEQALQKCVEDKIKK